MCGTSDSLQLFKCSLIINAPQDRRFSQLFVNWMRSDAFSLCLVAVLLNLLGCCYWIGPLKTLGKRASISGVPSPQAKRVIWNKCLW